MEKIRLQPGAVYYFDKTISIAELTAENIERAAQRARDHKVMWDTDLSKHFARADSDGELELAAPTE